MMVRMLLLLLELHLVRCGPELVDEVQDFEVDSEILGSHADALAARWAIPIVGS